MKFTYAEYGKMLSILKKHNYRICDYHAHSKYDKAAVLRHDIDMDIQRAVEMARLEAELGVRATYFVLISSDFYNVFSARNTAGLREITALGHSVGLHFDEMKYRNTPPPVSCDENRTGNRSSGNMRRTGYHSFYAQAVRSNIVR